MYGFSCATVRLRNVRPPVSGSAATANWAARAASSSVGSGAGGESVRERGDEADDEEGAGRARASEMEGSGLLSMTCAEGDADSERGLAVGEGGPEEGWEKSGIWKSMSMSGMVRGSGGS